MIRGNYTRSVVKLQDVGKNVENKITPTVRLWSTVTVNSHVFSKNKSLL